VIEDKVAELTEQCDNAHTMAAMADRDVAVFRQEMRGHTGVLHALRDTQLEHGRMLDEHGRTLADHGRTLETLVAGQAAILQHLRIDEPDTGERAQD
jgi:hypothetical protein